MVASSCFLEAEKYKLDTNSDTLIKIYKPLMEMYVGAFTRGDLETCENIISKFPEMSNIVITNKKMKEIEESLDIFKDILKGETYGI